MAAPRTGRSKAEAVPVTADNFIRAESDMYFGIQVKLGAFGKFHRIREPIPSTARHRAREMTDREVELPGQIRATAGGDREREEISAQPRR
jgi:hypothetical protein